MKRKTNFEHVSTKEAKNAAIADMKSEGVKYYTITDSRILHQPNVTYRMGLLGLI